MGSFTQPWSPPLLEPAGAMVLVRGITDSPERRSARRQGVCPAVQGRPGPFATAVCRQLTGRITLSNRDVLGERAPSHRRSGHQSEFAEDSARRSDWSFGVQVGGGRSGPGGGSGRVGGGAQPGKCEQRDPAGAEEARRSSPSPRLGQGGEGRMRDRGVAQRRWHAVSGLPPPCGGTPVMFGLAGMCCCAAPDRWLRRSPVWHLEPRQCSVSIGAGAVRRIG
jgi:hypothetical protein